MGEVTYRFTIFLLKENVKDFEQCIKADKEVAFMKLKDDKNLDGVIVIGKSSIKKAAWINFLEYYSEDEITINENVSNKAVMLVRLNERIMAVTFGYGRAFLKEEYIEKNFGLLTALNMLDEKQIRSINAATIEDMVVHTQKQSSYATNQDEFSLNVINDIMTSIAGKSKDELWANSVSGKDSLLVSVEMFPDELKDKLQIYLSAYESDAYKMNGFSWIDNVREIRDVSLKEILENIILERLRRKDIENIYVSPPETVDWNSVKGFMISGTGKRKDNLSNYKEDLELVEYVENLNAEKDLKKKVKGDRIFALNINDEFYPISSLYAALVAQIEYNNELYILCDSRWFKIENDFFKKVKSFVAAIPVSDIKLPNCSVTEAEGDYNERISEMEGFALMDKKLIGANGGARQIEACDIFTENKQFIHVKNRSSSAQLSHLFAQGRVSAECFISDEEFRKQVHTIVKNKLGKNVFSYRKKPGSNEFEVIYAIIAKKIGPVEENLPFFSLVNLMLAVQELDRMHMKYSVKMILKE